MNNPFLIGDKVYLRALERADAPTLLPWFNDPDVRRFLLGYRPLNLQAEERFIDQIADDAHAVGLLIVRRDNDQLIGATGFKQINWKNRNAEFGINIGDKSCWGQGYGTEATALMIDYGFGTLNLHRILLQVFEYNPRAAHVYEKLGFKKEGVLRQEHFRDGRYWDTIVMGLLREERGRRQ
jgi:RimJ/RimL family protein N-acetyltransferase